MTAQQQGASFPVRSQQWTATVDAQHTHFSATAYSDWVMLVATQTGTLGTVMQARCAALFAHKFRGYAALPSSLGPSVWLMSACGWCSW